MRKENLENKERRGLLLIGAIVLLGLLTAVLVVRNKPKSKTVSEESKQENVKVHKEETDPYSKLKQVFSEDEVLYTKIANGFEQVGLLNDDSDIKLYLDKHCVGNPELRWIGPNGNEGKDKYYSKDLFNELKENEELCNLIHEMANRCDARELDYNRKTHELQFYFNAEKTPFIKDNDNLGTVFIYSHEAGLESKGYRKIKDNWYMWILPKGVVSK